MTSVGAHTRIARARRGVLGMLLGAGLVCGSSAGGQPAPRFGDGAKGSLGAKISRVRDGLQTTKQRKSRVEAEIEGVTKQRSAARERMRTRARALYRMSRAGMLPLAGGFEAMLSHVGRLDRLQRMVKKDMAAVESLAQRRGALKAERDNLARRLDEAKRRLARLKRRKPRPVEPMQSRATPRSAGADRGSGVPESASRKPSPATGSIRLAGGGPATRSGDEFEAKRGELGMPLEGTFRARDARREDGPGLEFVTDPGTPVRAVAEGKVAFADRRDPYGRLVILDHGNDYYTVYGGLGRIDVQVDDYVGRGARTGEVGREGDPPALYFEVRHGTRVQDPRAWLGM